MEHPQLQKTGYVMILGGSIFSILSFFPFLLNLHLLISASYSSFDQFGPAGQDIVLAFGVHLGSLVIALGLVTVGLSKHYHPDFKPYLLGGVGIWYVLDCVSSLVLGYEYNVIPNTLMLIGFLVTMRSFDRGDQDLNED